MKEKKIFFVSDFFSVIFRHCDRCRCSREAAKKIELWKLPPVLIVQFKRFGKLNRTLINAGGRVIFARDRNITAIITKLFDN